MAIPQRFRPRYSKWVMDPQTEQAIAAFEGLTPEQIGDLGPEVAVLRGTLAMLLGNLDNLNNPSRDIVRVIDQIREIVRTTSEVRLQESYVQLADALALRDTVAATIAKYVPDEQKRRAFLADIRSGLAQHMGRRLGQPALIDHAGAIDLGGVQPGDEDTDAGGAGAV